MPSDDVILNLRQITGYPSAVTPQPADTLVLQRGGLGGPYVSLDTATYVGEALADAGPLSVGLGLAPDDAAGWQVFTGRVVLELGQTANWNCYVSTPSENFSVAGSGPSGIFGLGADGVFRWDAAPSVLAGATPVMSEAMSLGPGGYLTVADTVLLGRDPQTALEAASSQWVLNSTVTSLNGRRGNVTLSVWDVCGAAPIHSPRFTGQPYSTTPAPNSCSDRIATTAFVHGTITQYIDNLTNTQPFVLSFNGRSGDIVLTAADIAAANPPYAPIDSPAFTGYPTAPTAPQGSSSGQLATTAFVMNAVTDSTTGVVSFNTRTGAVVLAAADLTAAGGALLSSPVFIGTPQAPTAALGTSTAQLATTAFVMNELGGLAAGVVSFNGRSGAVTLNSTDISNAGGALAGPSVTSFNSRTGAVTLAANDISAAGGLINPSVALTGVPTAPTAAPSTNTTQLATCAFVTAAIAAASGNVVSSFNTRVGAVTLTLADITGAGGAAQTSLANYLPLAGGVLSGGIAFNVTGLQGTPTANNIAFGVFNPGQDSSGWSPNGFLSITLATVGTAAGYMVRTLLTPGSMWPVHIIGSSLNQLQMSGIGPQVGSGTLSWSTTVCDERVKQDLTDAGDGLAVVNEVPVYACTYARPGNDFRQHWDYTLIAGQVRDKIPFAYMEPPPGGYASLHPLHLIATLWKAVQQLSERVAALEGART